MKSETITVDGGGSFEFTERVRFRCPCGLLCRIGRDGADVPLALHAEPRCAEYEQLDLVEYMAWARTHGAQVLQ